MTGDATFCPDCRMFKSKWACFIGMAGEAHLVLGSGRAQLVRIESAVGIVAIAAGDQAFIDLMMKGPGKIGFLFLMASEAESGLRRRQKLLFDLRRVDRVAINATHVVLQVLGTKKVAVLFVEFMAAQAALRRFFARKVFKVNDIGGMGGFRVCPARAVTRFASLPCRTVVLIGFRFPMRTSFKTVEHLLVAALAGIGAYVLGWIGRIGVRSFGLGAFALISLLLALRPGRFFLSRVILLGRCHP